MTRKQFLQLVSFVLASNTMNVEANQALLQQRAPAFFVGHGSPLNAISDNAFTRSLIATGKHLPKPRAILMVSAHWTPPYIGVTVHKNRQLMYDFFGFPDALYDVQYPAANARFLEPLLVKEFTHLKVAERSLDHGSWSVLKHMFPEADIPVMQFGIHNGLTLQEHFALAKRLKFLRHHGVMIIGSGNITHNLGKLSHDIHAPIEPWAKAFDSFVKKAIEQRDFDALVKLEHKYASLAHPTLEHYIPLLYIAGVSDEKDSSSFEYEAIEHGSMSMRNWLLV